MSRKKNVATAILRIEKKKRLRRKILSNESIFLKQNPGAFSTIPKPAREEGLVVPVIQSIFRSHLRSRTTMAMPATPTATNNSRYNFSPFARIIQTFFILSFSGRVDPRRSFRRIYHPRPRRRRRLFPSTLASLSGVIKFLRYRARPNCTEWNPKQSANAISSEKNNASSRPRNSRPGRFLFLKILHGSLSISKL